MTKRVCWGVFALALGVVGVVSGSEGVPRWRAKTDVLVTSFGAKGDGVTDDTVALQRAADALADLNGEGIHPFYSVRRKDGRDGLDREQPRLVFPKGVYRLTAPVIFRNKLFAVGEDAEIVQEDAKADVFYVQAAFICRVSGLSFKGGKSQLRFATHNTECANIRVSGCSFFGSSDAAIECKSYRTEGKGDRKKLAFGEWKWNPVTRRNERDPRWEQKKLVYNNSTFFLIENCAFDECRRAADINPDGGMIRDCRVRSSRAASGGVFRLADVMHVMRLDILIRRNRDLDQCAFELYNDMMSGAMIDFWAEDSTLRTDDGTGVPFVTCNLGKQGYIASSVVLENIATETPDASGIVRIAKGGPPSIVALLRVRETRGKDVRMLQFDCEDVEAAMAEGNPTGPMGIIPLEKTYSFTLIGCENVLPPSGAAAKYLRPCPKDAGRETFREPQGKTYAGPVLLATDDGVDCDPETDDTESIRRFLGRLSAVKGGIGVLPATLLRISGSLPLSGDFLLVGAGVPVIETANDAFDVFSVDAEARVTVRDIQFRGGKSVVDVPAGAAIRMEGCFAYDPKMPAIRIRQDGRFAMDGCVVYARYLYEGDGVGFLGSTWFRYLSPNGPKGPMTPGAAIVNRGRLQAWDILGVPTVFSRYRWDDLGQPEDVPFELRWVDNAGEYYSRGFRYGGEWGGVTPIFHFGNARTAMEGSHAWFETFHTQRTPILADTPEPNARCFAVAFSANRRIVPDIALLWRATVGDPLQTVSNACIDCVYPLPKDGGK